MGVERGACGRPRRLRIVKVLWDPESLTAALRDLGWHASLTRRDPFYWGVVTPIGTRTR